MSPQSILGAMTGAKKEKHYANIRARRGSVVVSQAGSSKKSKKDTDTDSLSSEASTVVPPPPPKPQCPLRPYMEVMFEPSSSDSSSNDETKKARCPLRRVKLSHTLPLCLFVMINMCLVIGTLLITGFCRLTCTLWDWGQKPARTVDHVVYKHSESTIDFSALTFLAMALFAFFVTFCYGPEWMSRAFQIISTVGFFGGLSITLLAKRGRERLKSDEDGDGD